VSEKRPWYTFAWIGWILAFVVIEAASLLDRRSGDTFSEHVRKWFNIEENGPKRVVGISAFIVIVVGFVAWFIPHIVVTE
jgi:hypothetical protein